MEAPGLWFAILDRADGVLVPAIEDLTPDELRAQPAGDASNPIGWLAWHLTYIQDRLIADIAGTPMVWDRDHWCGRFRHGEEALHIDPAEVGTFDPATAETLLGYYRAVRRRGEEVLESLSAADLDREGRPASSGRPAMTVTEMLAMAASDNLQHIGQIAYLRGLLREQGWYEKRRR